MRYWSSFRVLLVTGIFVILLFTAFVGFGKVPPSTNAAQPGETLLDQAHAGSLDNVYNSTLGFQKLFVISLPERTDHRDALSLGGALTGLQFDWIDGVRGETVPETALPPGSGEKFTLGGRGSWRAHMDAIRAVIEQDLSSALIFEDDVDWDVRIKDQLRDFAMSSRALLQPLSAIPGRFADPTFPEVTDPNLQPEPMMFERLPKTIAPIISPFGDDWDILWLGHCGMRRSKVGLVDQRWSKLAVKTPKGYVVHEDDNTVPQTQYVHVFDDPGHPHFREDFKNHTRIVSHAMDGICTLAYAVSQAGARKLLYDLAILKFDDYFDIMLREFCDGQNGHDRHRCLTVQPTLFNHHRLAGSRSHDSEIKIHVEGDRNTSFTNNIRWSTRLNLARLIKGGTEFEDQWPDAQD